MSNAQLHLWNAYLGIPLSALFTAHHVDWFWPNWCELIFHMSPIRKAGSQGSMPIGWSIPLNAGQLDKWLNRYKMGFALSVNKKALKKGTKKITFMQIKRCEPIGIKRMKVIRYKIDLFLLIVLSDNNRWGHKTCLFLFAESVMCPTCAAQRAPPYAFWLCLDLFAVVLFSFSMVFVLWSPTIFRPPLTLWPVAWGSRANSQPRQP